MSDEDDVGYGHPPKKNRFQTGVSGNPAGRPRKKLTIPEIVAKVRDETIPMTINGKRTKVGLFEASLRQTVGQTLAHGKPRDLEKLLQMLEKHGVTPSDVMAEDARRGAEATVTKLFQLLERTHEDVDETAQAIVKGREVHTIESCSSCRNTLNTIWAGQDQERARKTFKTPLRLQIEETRLLPDNRQ